MAQAVNVFSGQSHEVFERTNALLIQQLKDRILWKGVLVLKGNTAGYLFKAHDHVRASLSLGLSRVRVAVSLTVLECRQQHCWITTASNLVLLIANAIWQFL